jgi:hypothetical protein
MQNTQAATRFLVFAGAFRGQSIPHSVAGEFYECSVKGAEYTQPIVVCQTTTASGLPMPALSVCSMRTGFFRAQAGIRPDIQFGELFFRV